MARRGAVLSRVAAGLRDSVRCKGGGGVTTASMRILGAMQPGTLHRLYEPKRLGSAEIRIDSPSMMERLRAARDGQPLNAKKYTRLFVDGRLFMTDAEFERRTNLWAVANMRGEVLIAGLGLGFMLLPTLTKSEVTSVTVLERSADVIALIGPVVKHKKLSIIKADCKSYAATKRAFDCIYFDIWSDVPNSDNKDEIKALKKKYRPALRSGGWMRAWCEEMLNR